MLAHNRVRHTVDMLNGRNGFRRWTWPQDKVPRNFKCCKCGWSGLHTIGCASSRRAKMRKVIAASRNPS